VSALDLYLHQNAQSARPEATTSGSLWSPGAPLGDLSRDLRARLVGDLITIVVLDRASATSSGTVSSSRKSDLKAGVSAAYGIAKPELLDLAGVSSASNLDGQGTTTRETLLSTTLSAHVTHVLPNGNLVVEGTKDTVVNSERQMITIRGIARPFDVTPANSVRSDRLAMLEVRINGKGVVNDAIRRPNFLYRLVMGLLPF
jgi:flagellar L-ring protein precursor FlgH